MLILGLMCLIRFLRNDDDDDDDDDNKITKSQADKNTA
jgi:hypothetical protein